MEIPLRDRPTESPVYFQAGGETLLGILTTAQVPSHDTAVIVLTGRGFPSPNRNRLSVYLCRTLAKLGFPGLRFDYHGIGESTGVAEGFELSKPFVQDLDGAIGCLRNRGFEKFVLIGSCFGARTALSLAPSIEGLEGLVLVAVPLHDDRGADLALRLKSGDYVRRAMRVRTLRHLFQADHRKRYLSLMRSKLALMSSNGRTRSGGNGTKSSASPIKSTSASLEAILTRGVPVLFLYGTDDHYFQQFQWAKRLRLGDLLKESGELVQVVELAGSVHGFTSIEAQTQVIEAIRSWFHERLMNQPDPRLEESS